MTILWPNIFLPHFSFFFCRQLLSWYTLSQNSNVSAMDGCPALLPLWVRCDMSDPAGTAWFGAENLRLRDGNAPGVKFYSVTCRGRCHIRQRWSVSLALSSVPCSWYFYLQQAPQSIKSLLQLWMSWSSSTWIDTTRLRWVADCFCFSVNRQWVFILRYAYRCW